MRYLVLFLIPLFLANIADSGQPPSNEPSSSKSASNQPSASKSASNQPSASKSNQLPSRTSTTVSNPNSSTRKANSKANNRPLEINQVLPEYDDATEPPKYPQGPLPAYTGNDPPLGPDAVNLDDYVGGTFDDGKSRRKLDKKAEALPGWVHLETQIEKSSNMVTGGIVRIIKDEHSQKECFFSFFRAHLPQSNKDEEFSMRIVFGPLVKETKNPISKKLNPPMQFVTVVMIEYTFSATLYAGTVLKVLEVLQANKGTICQTSEPKSFYDHPKKQSKKPK